MKKVMHQPLIVIVAMLPLLLLLCPVAYAKTPTKANKPAAAAASVKSSGGTKKTTIVYEKETKYRFDDSLIEGRIIKPDGFFLLRKRPKKWQDLIKVREHFNPELAEMKYEF